MSRIASSPCMSGDEARAMVTAGVCGTCSALLQQSAVAQSSERIESRLAKRLRTRLVLHAAACITLRDPDCLGYVKGEMRVV